MEHGEPGEWRKSSLSAEGACVEVRLYEGGVQVRDSKDGAGAVLTFNSQEWRAFVDGVRLGEFDTGG